MFFLIPIIASAVSAITTSLGATAAATAAATFTTATGIGVTGIGVTGLGAAGLGAGLGAAEAAGLGAAGLGAAKVAVKAAGLGATGKGADIARTVANAIGTKEKLEILGITTTAGIVAYTIGQNKGYTDGHRDGTESGHADGVKEGSTAEKEKVLQWLEQRLYRYYAIGNYLINLNPEEDTTIINKKASILGAYIASGIKITKNEEKELGKIEGANYSFDQIKIIFLSKATVKELDEIQNCILDMISVNNHPSQNDNYFYCNEWSPYYMERKISETKLEFKKEH